MIARMPNEFDLAAETGAAVTDRPRLWRFVRGFAAAWRTPLRDGDGVPAAELDAVERRLGVPLPAAMREAYGLFGRRADLTANQDRFGIGELGLDDGMLVFRVENQSCTSWAVPAGALSEEDPPVYFLDPLTDDWRPHLDRFSLCCLDVVLSEAVLGGDAGHHDNRDLDEAAVAELARRYRRLPIPDYPVWGAADGPPVRWFTGPDVLLRDDGRDWLWALARTEPALERLRQDLPGDWLCAPHP